MYSIVLMAALTTGTEATAWNGGCRGCNGGCYGYAASSCYGCYGGYSGCWGGRRGCFGGRYGCYGGYGCWGNGCAGYYSGCYGGCWGGGSCYGCYGYAGYNSYGYSSYYYGGGSPYAVVPLYTPTANSAVTQQTASATRATLIVSLPADANLTVEGAATRSTSSTRVFTSPDLPAGKDFYYELTGKITRDGQTLTVNKQVRVRAGEETRVALDFPTATTAYR